MTAIILILLGTLLALVMGVRALAHADALAAFYLYQAALGAADLITLSLRGRRRADAAHLASAGLWLAALAYVAYRGDPFWALAAVATSAALAVVHRPDVGLFSIATLPVSATLILIALLRGEPFPWGYLALLLAMLALYRWRARGAPKHTEAST